MMQRKDDAKLSLLAVAADSESSRVGYVPRTGNFSSRGLVTTASKDVFEAVLAALRAELAADEVRHRTRRCAGCLTPSPPVLVFRFQVGLREDPCTALCLADHYFHCGTGTLASMVPQYQVTCTPLLSDAFPCIYRMRQQVKEMMMPVDGIPSLLAVAAGSGSMDAFGAVLGALRGDLPEEVHFHMLPSVSYPNSITFSPETPSSCSRTRAQVKELVKSEDEWKRSLLAGAAESGRKGTFDAVLVALEAEPEVTKDEVRQCIVRSIRCPKGTAVFPATSTVGLLSRSVTR